MANNEFNVNGIDVRYKKINKDDYISLTDLEICKSGRAENSYTDLDEK